MSHRNSGKGGKNNSTLRLLAGSVALAGFAYGVYKYLNNLNAKTPIGTDLTSTEENANNFKSDSNIIHSNRLKPKQKLESTISLVISPTILKQIDQYNQENEDGIDLQNYLKIYPNLVIILYPGLTLENIENYFKIDDNLKYKILITEKEESIFHLLKHVGSNLNMINFNDFNMDKETIDKNFRLENILPNVISLDNNTLFIDII